MEIISKERLKELLEKEKVAVEILPNGQEDKENSYEIDFLFDMIVLKKGGTELKYKGYTVETFKGKQYVSKEFKSIKKLLIYLEKEKLFVNDEVAVVSYRSQFPTYQAHLDALAFNSIDMSGLLDKYLPYADRFSLTCPYCREGMKIYGTYFLSKAQADAVIEKAREELTQASYKVYCRFSDEEKSGLPPFEQLLKDIEQEIVEYREKHINQIAEEDGESFYCDIFSQGKAKYTTPQELWHIYINIDTIYLYSWIVEKMQQNKKQVPLDTELQDEYYSILKPDLLDVEVTFCWHCTCTSLLSKVFYFRLTENSIAWLRRLKNDYDMNTLEDLAFYKGDKVLFSSCTHEGFHSDCMNELDN